MSDKHEWPGQGIRLRYFRPGEFEHPEKMVKEFLLRLDGLRFRCEFPIQVNDDYRTDAEMASIYGDDRSEWPNSAHMRGRAVDIEPAGDLGFREHHRRKMLIMHHALSMWQGGLWPRLGLELATRHIHVDDDKELIRPYAWPGVSK